MFEHGWVLPQNQKEAARYFLRAARSHKVPQAMLHLAHMYDDGRGVPKDRLKAAFQAHQAARFGLKEAESLETELESRLTSEEQDQIRRWHEEWKPSPPGPWILQ
jgi:TPR repeat protein